MSLHSITKALSFTLHQSLGKNVSLFDSLKTLVYSWALILVVPQGGRLSLSFKSLLNDYSQPSREKDTQSIQYFVLIISFHIFVNRVVLAQMAKGKEEVLQSEYREVDKSKKQDIWSKRKMKCMQDLGGWNQS